MPAAGTGMGNAGKCVESYLAERAAVVWRRLVSGWLTLERGERSAAGTAERRAGEEAWIWLYWPPSHRCHEH